jgi:molecular chaperone DnaK (HSP70)
VTAVGIDFGTSNSVVSIRTPSGPEVLSMDTPLGDWDALGFDRVMPSVFGLDAADRALFGWAAKRSERVRIEAVKRMFATQDDIVEVDGQIYIVDEIVTMLFAEMRMRAQRQGVDILTAVVTIPANSRGPARARTRQCAGMAGIRVLTLVNEPMAAAMAHCARHPGDQRLLVFDWGGGTLDITFLSATDGYFIEEASMGLPLRGGIDFDGVLGRLLVPTDERDGWTPEQRRRFELDVELAKIKLSTAESTVVQLPSGRPKRVARAEFEAAAASLIGEARAPLERCLADVGLGAQVIDAVVMVGGTSKIPAVRRFVAEVMGRDVSDSVDPMTAVSEGAAVSAAILGGEVPDSRYFVCSEHALGVQALAGTYREQVFSVILPRNHILPAEGGETYVPIHPEQQALRLKILEGDPAKPLDHPDTVVLKTLHIDLPTRTDRTLVERAVEVTFRYDVECLLHVKVVEARTGTVLHDEPVRYGGAPTEAEQMRTALKAKRAVESGTVASEDAVPASGDAGARKLLRLAGRVAAAMHEADEPVAADAVQGAADAVRDAPAGDELAARKETLRALLRDYIWLDDEGALSEGDAAGSDAAAFGGMVAGPGAEPPAGPEGGAGPDGGPGGGGGDERPDDAPS